MKLRHYGAREVDLICGMTNSEKIRYSNEY
jgi:hypothetical protein